MNIRPCNLDAAARMLAELWSLPEEEQMGTMAAAFDAFVRVDRSDGSSRILSPQHF